MSTLVNNLARIRDLSLKQLSAGGLPESVICLGIAKQANPGQGGGQVQKTPNLRTFEIFRIRELRDLVYPKHIYLHPKPCSDVAVTLHCPRPTVLKLKSTFG